MARIGTVLIHAVGAGVGALVGYMLAFGSAAVDQFTIAGAIFGLIFTSVLLSDLW